MDRVACVDIPAMPLQLLLRRHPEWASGPAAVVAEDKPQGIVLWANDAARGFRVLPGLKYAAALSLCGRLQAGVISPSELRAGCDELVEVLHRFSPEVEPSAAEPGIAWVNASGLVKLYRSLPRWAGLMRDALHDAGFHATVVVGFTRFGAYATARTRRGVTIFKSRDDERREAEKVPLERLGIEPALRETLDRLAVRTVGAFLELPADGVLRRFGFEAFWLHSLASEDLVLPLQPQSANEPLERKLMFDAPESDSARLLFCVKRLLHPLMTLLTTRNEALAEISLILVPEDGEPREERLKPAAPSLDALLVLDLVRLRLENVELGAGITDLIVRVEGAEARPEQIQLFSERPRRDLDAAARALARVRAELGEEAVVHAVLQEGHLPEASFRWEPVSKPVVPQPRRVRVRPLVRRMHRTPRPAPRGNGRPELGPFIVSGGWWLREVHREYSFLDTSDGRTLWVYFDRKRRKWFMQGELE